MLTPEAFIKRRREVLKSASGIGLVEIARRRVLETTNNRSIGDTAVYWMENDRRYKGKKKSG